MNKENLRIWAKTKRKNLDLKNKSKVLTEKIFSNEEYKKSKNILIFYPKKNEINLLDLLKDKDKQFFLPRVCDNIIECCAYTCGDELKESEYKIMEPVCESCNKNIIDMAIIPALACDKNNYRLGYGGGYYDRFLKDFEGIKITCIPKELIVETVYPEKHDIKMDFIIDS